METVRHRAIRELTERLDACNRMGDDKVHGISTHTVKEAIKALEACEKIAGYVEGRGNVNERDVENI